MAGQSPIILTHFYCERMLLHRKVPFCIPIFLIGRLEDWKICIHGFFLVIFLHQAIFFLKMKTDCIFFTIFVVT